VSKLKKHKEIEKTPVVELADDRKQKPTTAGKDEAMPPGEAPLTPQDKQLFAAHEETIKQNIGGFLKVGMALKAIKDQKLHRAVEIESFENYCQERWGISDKYAYRLIEAYTCVDWLQKEISPMGETQLPTNEAQVRPLVLLEPDQQVKAWQQVLKACKGKSITAEKVEQVVAKMLGKPGTEKTTSSTANSKKVEQKLVKIGKLVDETLKTDDSKLTVANLKKILVRIRGMIEPKK
jgi:hypothetical protein